MKNILVVAAHPDDEVLGCGATLAKHAAAGDKVYTCFMTDGTGARAGGSYDREARKRAAIKAGSFLGVLKQFFLDFPDNQMDTVPLLEVIKEVEGVINAVNPDTIYTHFLYDLNIDHQLTHKAVITACRPQAGNRIAEILTFEVLSSTEWQSLSNPAFRPNVVNDVCKYFENKMEALRCYREEVRPFPHSRSLEAVEALAILRGATHCLEKAEVFQLERLIR